ncbi:MAG: thioredoxin-disulfide reductase [Ruminococcus sp.]|nr:thioredoxin-disulfide reductase [Ruminococcus sp.]
MYDLIIIGSGPAGLSAAVYAKRAGLETLVLEQNPMSGGQVLNTSEVDNYLGLPGMNGFDMGMKFREHAEKMGAVFENVQVKEIIDAGDHKIVKAAAGKEEKTYETKAIIAATGASHALLQVPGEEVLSGRGVSYCATCDGAFFKDKITAVVGGGDVAAEDALFLSRICKKVYLIHRRDALRAAKSLQEAVFACSDIEVLWDSVVEEICGQERVESLKLRNVKEDSARTLAVDGVFIAVGLVPNSELLRNVTRCDERGYVVAGEDCATQTAGIFAAGDVRTKHLRQIVTAVADGANAVAGVEKYLLQQ